MKKTVTFAILSSLLGFLPANAEVDCMALSLSVKQAIVANQAKILEVVSSQVSASPSCACEIVKTAIETSNADISTTAAIVEAASNAAPEQMRLVSQCAVAVAPDALAAVQMVMSKLDPNSGETGMSAKSSKDAKAPAGEVAAMPNPLDFPGKGPVGPTPGGPGGYALIPQLPPSVVPPSVAIPPVVVEDPTPITSVVIPPTKVLP